MRPTFFNFAVCETSMNNELNRAENYHSFFERSFVSSFFSRARYQTYAEKNSLANNYPVHTLHAKYRTTVRMTLFIIHSKSHTVSHT